MTRAYDLIVIGGGSSGLTAAKFGARLGASVALIESSRMGGDCTWTGCVPSKALLKVAKVAQTVRTAGSFGVSTAKPRVDMARVRAYLARVIAEVYQHETPARLAEEQIDVIHGATRFVDDRTIHVGDRSLTAKRFVISTGAKPFFPPVPGLDVVPFVTYEQLFENDVLPEHLIILGAGAMGVEIAQAYGRLGSDVTLVDVALLPREEPEAADVLLRVFQREGIRFVQGLATAVQQLRDGVLVNVDELSIEGDMLLVATGRRPNVAGLGLESAGVAYAEEGITVDRRLRTSAKYIYAAGTARAALSSPTTPDGKAFRPHATLLPGNSDGISSLVPRTIFTDPELAHIGLTEDDARNEFAGKISVARWNNDQVDRAVVDGAVDGYVKIVHLDDGTILGATVVSARAGEVISEFSLAMKHGLTVRDVAEALHVYPTYSMPVMQLSAEVATEQFLGSPLGRLAKRLSCIG